jgi:hypothetical protein
VSSTLVSAALLAACGTSPNMKELPSLGGTACLDGMTILFNIKGKQSRVSYTVLDQGTDQEITDWLYSDRKIGYLTWTNKFYMKEVRRDGTVKDDELLTYQLDNTDLYEFTLPECM